MIGAAKMGQLRMNKPEWVQEVARQPNCGKEFARLVRDLASAMHGKPAYSYDSRDGGIDVQIPDLGLAWQCKFVNPDTAINDVENHVKRQIASEFKKIHSQLTAEGPSKKQSQFEVWADSASVSSYIYATSIKLPNAKTRAALKTYLRDQLVKLAKAAKLDHLTKVGVEIWDEQTISVKIEESPNVRIKWFKLDLPPNVEKFSDWKRRRRGNEDDPQKRNFHAYVFGDVLPYQSYLDSSKRPESILSSLQGNSSAGVVLIHGAGGHGKSRLMVEVARSAEDFGWNVFMLSPAAREDLLDCVAKLAAGSPTLLLLDYAEHCGSLAPIYDRLRTLNANQRCRIALLMASRTTAAIDGTTMDDTSVTRVYISSNKFDQDHIIKQMLGAELEDLAVKCMYIPVFAAFIRLLRDRRQQDSLDELRRVDDFHAWIRRHVAGPVANRPALAKLCSLLPCSDPIMTQACERDPAVRAYRDSMLSDGWLIYALGAGNESWQIAHDLIADGAIIDALSGGTTANYHAQEILKFACSSESRLQCIRTLNRVADDPCVASVDWPSLFKARATEWLPFLYDIARGSLVPKEHMLAMMESMGVVIGHLNANLEIRRILGLIVRDAAYQHRPISDTEILWLERGVEVSPPAEIAFVTSYWLRTDSSTRASDAAIAFLRNHPTFRQCSYVYAGWLNSGRPWSAISALLNQWLVRYNTTPEAVFPIAAWLDYLQGQNILIGSEDWFSENLSIGNVVDRWLAAEARYKSSPAGLLYRAWIGATRDVETFEKKTISWLELHQGQNGTAYVLGALLVQGYPPDKLSGYMDAWVAKPANVTHRRACYLYGNWLRAGGSPTPIRNGMLTWLATKRPVDQMSFAATLDGGRMVLTTWLEKIGECDAVEPFVVQWLGYGQQHLEDNALYVFLSWLKAKGDQKVIRAQLVEWLKRPPGGTFIEQESVLSAWLKSAGMNRDDAEPFVQCWCDDMQNAATDRADFLVGNWRNVGGSADVVRNAIGQRAKFLKISTEFYFAAAPWAAAMGSNIQFLAHRLHSTDLPASFLEAVRRVILSAAEFPSVDLDFLLRRWIERMGRNGVVLLQYEFTHWVSGLHTFSQAPFTLAEMLGMKEIGQPGQRVERLAIDELTSKEPINEHIYIFRAWVRSGRPFADVHDFLRDWFAAVQSVNNIKCAEILRGIQASELGQLEWALRAINQFIEKHGGEALTNRIAQG